MKKSIILLLFATKSLFAQTDTALVITDNTKIVAPVATKRVLIEEGTGTWCGACVYGIVVMDELQKKYASTTGLVSVHSKDPMKDDAYVAATIFQSYPSGYIDRQKKKQFGVKDFEKEYLKRVMYVPAIDVFIDNVSWNAATRLLSFRVNATTVSTFNGSYRFNAVITEMKVHGTGSNYAQTNYYSGGSLGPMGGFENKPNPVPAADMYYDFVGRGLLGGWDGTANSIPATNAPGKTISYTYTKTIPATWNEKNINLIGFVINSTDGSVENASLTVDLPSVITGIGEEVKNNFIIYPNPTTGLIRIKNAVAMDISVYNLTGNQIMETERNVSQINLSDLPEGIYFVKFNNQKETYTKKIVLIK